MTDTVNTDSQDIDTPDPEASGVEESIPDAFPNDTLQEAITRHQLDIPQHALIVLQHYCQLLWRWNAKLNLTRHTNYDLFVARDLIDTLRLAAQIPEGTKVLDVGSGGGVPGIPLAIMRQDLKVSLAESVGKKSTVLQSMVQSMRIPVAVQHDRAENVLKRHRFEVITARAVAPLSKLLTWLSPGLKPGCQLLLIKGRRWTEEYDQANEEGLLERLTVTKLDTWPTPGRNGESVLLKIVANPRRVR
jgi:16S rRNA (guanine527-N7)-methyltransferase